MGGKMATAGTVGGSDKRPYKQDLPPKGGYAPFEYQRVPIKRFMSSPRLWGALLSFNGFGWWMLYHTKRTSKALKTEERSTDLALQPMLQAERDRAFLKRVIQNRDWEADIMRNVEGWQVGTYWGVPVLRSVENKFPCQRLWQHSTCCQGSRTSWPQGSIRQGMRSHQVRTACSWPSSLAGPSWQRRGSRQQWQHSTCCQGSRTSWPLGSIQQGMRSHQVRTACSWPSS